MKKTSGGFEQKPLFFLFLGRCVVGASDDSPNKLFLSRVTHVEIIIISMMMMMIIMECFRRRK